MVELPSQRFDQKIYWNNMSSQKIEFLEYYMNKAFTIYSRNKFVARFCF